MASVQELSGFLASVQRRAFRQARFAVQDDALALDLVQEAMTRLVERYADRPAAELVMLFQRILRNAITDHFRRRRVRDLWILPLSSFGGSAGEEGDEADALEFLADRAGAETAGGVDAQAERSQFLAILEEELARLPRRQREAFLLRYWEDMDVAATAEVMGCSEGSVKTHCSRACHALAAALRTRGIEP